MYNLSNNKNIIKNSKFLISNDFPYVCLYQKFRCSANFSQNCNVFATPGHGGFASVLVGIEEILFDFLKKNLKILAIILSFVEIVTNQFIYDSCVFWSNT